MSTLVMGEGSFLDILRNLKTLIDTSARINQKNIFANTQQFDDQILLKTAASNPEHSIRKNEFDIAIDELKSLVTNAFKYKGKLNSVSDLDTQTNKVVGDVFFIIENADFFIWDGTKWEDFGGIIDLSNTVDLTSDQTISGTKTFNKIKTQEPVDNEDVTTKIFVESLINNIIGNINDSTTDDKTNIISIINEINTKLKTIDLSQYYTAAEIDSKLENFEPSSGSTPIDYIDNTIYIEMGELSYSNRYYNLRMILQDENNNSYVCVNGDSTAERQSDGSLEFFQILEKNGTYNLGDGTGKEAPLAENQIRIRFKTTSAYNTAWNGGYSAQSFTYNSPSALSDDNPGTKIFIEIEVIEGVNPIKKITLHSSGTTGGAAAGVSDYIIVNDVEQRKPSTNSSTPTTMLFENIKYKPLLVSIKSDQTITGLKTFKVLPQSDADLNNDLDFMTLKHFNNKIYNEKLIQIPETNKKYFLRLYTDDIPSSSWLGNYLSVGQISIKLAGSDAPLKLQGVEVLSTSKAYAILTPDGDDTLWNNMNGEARETYPSNFNALGYTGDKFVLVEINSSPLYNTNNYGLCYPLTKSGKSYALYLSADGTQNPFYNLKITSTDYIEYIEFGNWDGYSSYKTHRMLYDLKYSEGDASSLEKGIIEDTSKVGKLVTINLADVNGRRNVNINDAININFTSLNNLINGYTQFENAPAIKNISSEPNSVMTYGQFSNDIKGKYFPINYKLLISFVSRKIAGQYGGCLSDCLFKFDNGWAQTKSIKQGLNEGSFIIKKNGLGGVLVGSQEDAIQPSLDLDDLYVPAEDEIKGTITTSGIYNANYHNITNIFKQYWALNNTAAPGSGASNCCLWNADTPHVVTIELFNCEVPQAIFIRGNGYYGQNYIEQLKCQIVDIDNPENIVDIKVSCKPPYGTLDTNERHAGYIFSNGTEAAYQNSTASNNPENNLYRDYGSNAMLFELENYKKSMLPNNVVFTDNNQKISGEKTFEKNISKLVPYEKLDDLISYKDLINIYGGIVDFEVGDRLTFECMQSNVNPSYNAPALSGFKFLSGEKIYKVYKIPSEAFTYNISSSKIIAIMTSDNTKNDLALDVSSSTAQLEEYVCQNDEIKVELTFDVKSVYGNFWGYGGIFDFYCNDLSSYSYGSWLGTPNDITNNRKITIKILERGSEVKLINIANICSSKSYGIPMKLNIYLNDNLVNTVNYTANNVATTIEVEPTTKKLISDSDDITFSGNNTFTGTNTFDNLKSTKTPVDNDDVLTLEYFNSNKNTFNTTSGDITIDDLLKRIEILESKLQ